MAFQNGEIIELHVDAELWIRVRPCVVHLAGLAVVHTVEDLVLARDAVDAMWAEMLAGQVRILRAEHPEVVALAQRVHEEKYHAS